MRISLLPRASTRAFIREARRARNFSLFNSLHGYVYGRWPYLYIGIGTGEHPLARAAKPFVAWIDHLIRQAASEQAGEKAGAGIGFADTYHGKVVTLEAATQLVKVGRDVNLGRPGTGHPLCPGPRHRSAEPRPHHCARLSVPQLPAQSLPAARRLPDRRRAVCQLRV